MNTLTVPTTSDVLLMYPGVSLTDQVQAWAGRHPDCQMAVSYERSLPKIRKLLDHAQSAVVDGTDDPSLAADTFLQAVARQGTDAVTMYTEKTNGDLELLVRVRGSPFLLGPMSEDEWDELFEQSLPYMRPAARLSTRLAA